MTNKPNDNTPKKTSLTGKRDTHLDSPDPLVSGAAGCGSLLLAAAGLVTGWLGFKLMRVNRQMALPGALSAERHTFISPTAGTLSYYADREVQGTPLVLIHSVNAAASSYEMRPLFDRLSDSRPVYALDLPGFGFLDRSRRNYTPDLYAQAIVDFIEKQVPRHPADVVALSLGGEFAALAALQRPELFRSLTLISPTGFSARPGASQRAAKSNTKNRIFGIISFRLWSQAIYDALSSRRSLRFFLKKNFVGTVDPGLLDYAYQTSHQPGARFAPLTFISGKLFTPNIMNETYNKLTIPVHVLYDRDPNVRFDALPETLKLPNWSATQITPTLGLPQFEKLDATEAALTEFWRGIP